MKKILLRIWIFFLLFNISFAKDYVYKAENGKSYYIIQNSKWYKIKKEDGSYAKKEFPSLKETIKYLKENTKKNIIPKENWKVAINKNKEKTDISDKKLTNCTYKFEVWDSVLLKDWYANYKVTYGTITDRSCFNNKSPIYSWVSKNKEQAVEKSNEINFIKDTPKEVKIEKNIKDICIKKFNVWDKVLFKSGYFSNKAISWFITERSCKNKKSAFYSWVSADKDKGASNLWETNFVKDF